ncbi:hypothetical protein ACYCFC_13455 [Stutzerimonas sp. NM35]
MTFPRWLRRLLVLDDLLQRYAGDLAQSWGDAGTRRTIVWPINMRLGRV